MEEQSYKDYQLEKEANNTIQLEELLASIDPYLIKLKDMGYEELKSLNLDYYTSIVMAKRCCKFANEFYDYVTNVVNIENIPSDFNLDERTPKEFKSTLESMERSLNSEVPNSKIKLSVTYEWMENSIKMLGERNFSILNNSNCNNFVRLFCNDFFKTDFYIAQNNE